MSNKIYESKKDKYEDETSSAATLLGIGIVGAAALILYWCGILPLPLSGPTRYTFSIVMGLMFVIFIILGIDSRRRAARFKSEMKAEAGQAKKIDAWIKEHLNASLIDEHCVLIGVVSETEKYMVRMDGMKKINAIFISLCEFSTTFAASATFMLDAL